MQYYKLVNGNIDLTLEGKEALATLGITLDELKNYLDEKLETSYWQGCKTFVDQALKNKKGITWLGEGRIPTDGRPLRIKTDDKGLENATVFQGRGSGWCVGETNQGRFLANLLVSDDVLNVGFDKGTKPHPITASAETRELNKQKGWGTVTMPNNKVGNYGDSGSFSRYFDLDKWFEERIKQLPESVQKTFPFLIVPKASKGEKNKGISGETEKDIGHNRFDRCAVCGGYILQNPTRPSACKCKNPVREHNKMKGNIHPTVKPLKLMTYLITLGSREGDVILDPFVGSGTTMLASKLLGRKCIGIEIEEKYCEIAANRCRQMVFNLYKGLNQDRIV